MVLLLLFCVFLLPKVIVFFMPFVIAAIIALIANPFVKFLEKRIRITRKAGTAMVIVIVIALVVLILYLLIYNLITQLIGFISSAPETWRATSETIRSFSASLRQYFERFPVPVREWSDTFLNNIIERIGDSLAQVTSLTSLLSSSGEGTTSMGLILVSIIMGILASYFFLADKDYVVNFLERNIPSNILSRWVMVLDTMKSAVGGYFIAQFKIMVFMYIELFIGFLILKVPFSFLIALVIALLDFLPFFGTGAVMWPWALIELIGQDYKTAIGLLAIWGLGQAIRQLIQPKLVGDSIGLEPIPTLIFLYVGFRVGGAFGLIVAVPVGMVILNLYRAGVFSNFKYSIALLSRDFDNLRKFSREDLIKEGIIKIEEGNKGTNVKESEEGNKGTDAEENEEGNKGTNAKENEEGNKGTNKKENEGKREEEKAGKAPSSGRKQRKRS